MADREESILLIESDLHAATFIRSALADARDGPFAVEWVASLDVALERLGKGWVKTILVNLFLSDSEGIETFDKLYAIESQVPVLILSDLGHEGVAKLAIQRGAQDYLLAGHIDGYSLSRAIRNVAERKMAEEVLFLERERAQVTLNSIGNAVISTDLAGNITYLNVVAERMTGWSKAEAGGKPFTDVFRIIDCVTRESPRNPMDLAIRENKPVGLAMDSILIRRDGFETAIEDSAAPIRDRGGHVTGAVIVFHDVSEAQSMTVKMS